MHCGAGACSTGKPTVAGVSTHCVAVWLGSTGNGVSRGGGAFLTCRSLKNDHLSPVQKVRPAAGKARDSVVTTRSAGPPPLTCVAAAADAAPAPAAFPPPGAPAAENRRSVRAASSSHSRRQASRALAAGASARIFNASLDEPAVRVFRVRWSASEVMGHGSGCSTVARPIAPCPRHDASARRHQSEGKVMVLALEYWRAVLAGGADLWPAVTGDKVLSRRLVPGPRLRTAAAHPRDRTS